MVIARDLILPQPQLRSLIWDTRLVAIGVLSVEYLEWNIEIFIC